MEIIRIDNTNETRFQTSLALGNFDGVHIGHQKLIRSMIETANESGFQPSMMIFENHTKSFVFKNGPRLISSNDQKNRFLEKLGVKTLYTMVFDDEIMTLSPEEFVTSILYEKLNCRAITVGPDYRFGYKAQGNVDQLISLSRELGIKTDIIQPVYHNDILVSSTRVREHLTDGEILEANTLLGRPFSVIGEVIHGKGLGKKLGVPTANIRPMDKYVIPKKGIYMTYTVIDGKTYPSATNIGVNPTFDEVDLKIENHIIGFDDEIYGKQIEIFFLEYIRPEKKFDSVEDLKSRMKEDIRYVKQKSDLQL
ncbi:MAG TPA: bifunctional riboflavin kinase/FAD synthetase [Tissierellaceae bacterium]|nr:bifunctional riboflavin kinase/FAD synthetase [Tissierellaceae bacterium]